MRIDEGRLIDAPCPHCGHMEHRAFGESESPRGELASYALGWTSGHEDVVGHMTIGIGVGNPGGGSFHIDVRVADGALSMSLVDRPFEDVPEGGPDLTREQALAHEALKFVWWVADEVMVQDRRAWWMEHYLRTTRAFATLPVVHGQTVLGVVREEDAEWQLLCGTVPPDDPQVFHLHHALDRDVSLLEVLDLEPGQRADRMARGRAWTRASAKA
jgi:hypothetical protein